MKLGDIDVRDFAARLDKRADKLEDGRMERRKNGTLTVDMSSGLLAAQMTLWSLSRVLRDIADEADKAPEGKERALDLDN